MGRATQGNAFAESFQSPPAVESRGNSLSRRCIVDAIDQSGVIRKVLAGEVGQTEGQFSKSLNGQPGGDFNEVLDNIRPAIRLDYLRRMMEAERIGGLEELAAESLAHAAIRYLSTRRIQVRMVKAGLR